MPPALQLLQRHLLKHPGGDRIMAQVLSSIPIHGLDMVPVRTWRSVPLHRDGTTLCVEKRRAAEQIQRAQDNWKWMEHKPGFRQLDCHRAGPAGLCAISAQSAAVQALKGWICLACKQEVQRRAYYGVSRTARGSAAAPIEPPLSLPAERSAGAPAEGT